MRCLDLTAQFEGHGFGEVAGDFDGAGLTWGIIGFTLKSGSLVEVLKQIPREVMERAMPLGAAADLRALVVLKGFPERLAWAKQIILDPKNQTKAKPAWVQHFENLGDAPEVQAIQLEVARRKYWKPAVEIAQALDFEQEVSFALAFDRQVQQNGIERHKIPAIKRRATTEETRLAVMTEMLIERSKNWGADVRARCEAVLNGFGKVHGRAYDVAAYGLQPVKIEEWDTIA